MDLTLKNARSIIDDCLEWRLVHNLNPLTVGIGQRRFGPANLAIEQALLMLRRDPPSL